MRKKTVKIPIYYGELTIIQVKNLAEIERKYMLSSLHGMDACVFTNHKKNGFTRYVMAFNYNTDASIIAHEALHIVGHIFLDARIKFQHDNDEPQCYLLGWIVDECHKFLKVKKCK